ncbi:hypothetical protein BDQ17DRAFT_1019802 [Cyathus striatus]|nr:hypothetical protein BDQ17DRAFT_1019802 [Cyathus striatus]
MNATFEGSSEGRKEKKTRRRLRLSCVECTKRRQKCDRNYPCSLCVSRGVAHLCRWETVPVARPPPARPPVEALRATNATDTDTIIKELSARVALLERALAEQKSQHPSPPGRSSEGEEPTSTPSPQSNFSFGDNTTSTRTSPELSHHPTPSFPAVQEPENKPKDEDLSSSDAFLHDELYEATSTLAQLSLGHHGEYVGRGSILCALHSISTKNIPRFFYANSTHPTGAKREPTYRFSALPSYTDIDSLLRIIPPINVVKALTDGFFSENNWRFGIPEQWFHTACSHMWSVIQYSALQGAETNASWLMLLFAVLANSPAHIYKEASQHPSMLTSDDYFMCAMMARRIAEDDYLHKPTVSMLSSPADGTVLVASPYLFSRAI